MLEALRAVDDAFEEERGRHEAAIHALRARMHVLIARGRRAGIGVTSMSKALGMSRGRLNAIIRNDLPPES